jgi:hypothetical protein
MRFQRAALGVLLLASSPAYASRPCACESERAEMTAFRDRIAGADSPEAAREMALSQTQLGHVAIARAARIFPRNAELQQADRRLSEFEGGIESASTQADVALQFDQLMAGSHASGSCSYTTTEVVIIVIGFVLGILPGILFLFLFC